MVNIHKSSKKIINHPLMRWVIIPCLLLLIWVGLSLYYFQSTSGFTVLQSSYPKSNIINWSPSEIVKGKKIVGQFKATENNLGIVAVRFNTFSRINQDSIHFAIKEKGSSKWYYEYNYTTPQFQQNQLFTFGFPVISNSEGKIYEFQLSSLQGEKGNAVALSSAEPAFVARYQYSKQQVLSSKQYFITFLIKKTINSLTNIDFLVSSIVYAIPFFLYLVVQLFFKRFLSKLTFLAYLPVVAILLESFLVDNRNTLVILGLLVFLVSVFTLYRITGRLVLLMAGVMLILCPLVLYLKLDQVAENIAMWAYLLIAIGTLFLIKEETFK